MSQKKTSKGVKSNVNKDTTTAKDQSFYRLIELFEQTQTTMRTQAARSVDIALVVRNWLFGWYIVEFEDGGADRSELYGKKLFDNLAQQLKVRGIKGMSTTNLRLCRAFYEQYSKIRQTLSGESFIDLQQIQQTLSDTSFMSSGKKIEIGEKVNKNNDLVSKVWQGLHAQFSLSWSHYIVLLTITADDERRFYELESIENAWSIRELKRQINASLYERLALSRDKAKVKELSEEGQLIAHPSDVLKSPYVLEFLQLDERSHYSEHELETAIINKIEHFLLELGKGLEWQQFLGHFSYRRFA